MSMKKAPRAKPGQTVATWMDEELVVRLDSLAEKAGITRSKLVYNMVEMSTKSLERADSFGVLNFALLMRDWEDNLRAWVRLIRTEGKEIKADYESGATEELDWSTV
jgi:hypothetical protein